jgi:hypothetical protein
MNGNYILPQMGQNNFNQPPVNPYNYPKIDHSRSTSTGQQPRFKEKEVEVKKDEVSRTLAKELESEIKELQQLTKEAKELAEKVVLSLFRKKLVKKRKSLPLLLRIHFYLRNRTRISKAT